jgi:hypothetical protein
MSFVIQGPYPLMTSSLVMPSPLVGNTEANTATVSTVRAMDGTVYTYVKTKRGRRVFNWNFVTSKDKALEAKEFIKLFASGLVRVTDQLEVVRIGYITINPLEQGGEGRASGWGKNEEAYQYSITFEERV